jgi:hypothetical protein
VGVQREDDLTTKGGDAVHEGDRRRSGPRTAGIRGSVAAEAATTPRTAGTLEREAGPADHATNGATPPGDGSRGLPLPLAQAGGVGGSLDGLLVVDDLLHARYAW